MSESKFPKTMLAWQKHLTNKRLVRVEVPVPSAPDDGLLIKIHAAGVCHSDWAILNRDSSDKFTLGHEGCGEIVEKGSSVTQFSIGDMACMLCPRHGMREDGCFAPYIAVNHRNVVKLPAGLSPAEGAVATDAIVTAYHAIVKRAQVKKTDTVLLYGLGGLGFNALQILLHIGARVIVVDKRQETLDEAVKFGVKSEDVVPVDTASVSEWVSQRRLVVDKTIDFVGVPETFKTALESVVLSGTVVLVGLLKPVLTLDALVAVRKNINILCCFGSTLTELGPSIDLIAKGFVAPQVTTGSLEDLPQVLDDLHAGKVKSRVALVPNGIR